MDMRVIFAIASFASDSRLLAWRLMLACWPGSRVASASVYTYKKMKANVSLNTIELRRIIRLCVCVCSVVLC